MKQLLIVFGVAIVALIGIQRFEPDYGKLQTAANADAFRALLGDERARALAANLSDFVFAAAYGTFGVLLFRALFDGRGVLVGTWLIASAAIADEIENVFVFTNVIRSDTTTDGWINVMRAFGYAKYALLVLSLLCLAVFAVARLARG